MEEKHQKELNQVKADQEGQISRLQEVNRLAMGQVAQLRAKSGDAKIELEQEYQKKLGDERTKYQVSFYTSKLNHNELVFFSVFSPFPPCLSLS